MKDAAELDLGIMPEEAKSCEPCCSPKTDEPRYPELTFRGKHADLFREKYGQCAPGDEYEATVRLRVKVSGDSDSETDDYNKRIEFAVIALIGDVIEEEPTEEKEEKPAPAVRSMGKSKKKEEAAAY